MFILRQALQIIQPKDCLASVDFQKCRYMYGFVHFSWRSTQACMYVYICLSVCRSSECWIWGRIFFLFGLVNSLQQCRFLGLFRFCKSNSFFFLHISAKMTVKWLHMWDQSSHSPRIHINTESRPSVQNYGSYNLLSVYRNHSWSWYLM